MYLRLIPPLLRSSALTKSRLIFYFILFFFHSNFFQIVCFSFIYSFFFKKFITVCILGHRSLNLELVNFDSKIEWTVRDNRRIPPNSPVDSQRSEFESKKSVKMGE
jgi:hypothetical protein